MRLLVFAALVLVACKPLPLDEVDMACGSASDCPADHRCDIDTLICVADTVPDLARDFSPPPDLYVPPPPDMAKCPDSPCRRDQICCDGKCILPDDPKNCGACGKVCPALYLCCGTASKPYVCTSLINDDKHCGRCNNECTNYCMGKVCQP